jgi:hypothetical protein
MLTVLYSSHNKYYTPPYTPSSPHASHNFNYIDLPNEMEFFPKSQYRGTDENRESRANSSLHKLMLLKF